MAQAETAASGSRENSFPWDEKQGTAAIDASPPVDPAPANSPPQHSALRPASFEQKMKSESGHEAAAEVSVVANGAPTEPPAADGEDKGQGSPITGWVKFPADDRRDVRPFLEALSTCQIQNVARELDRMGLLSDLNQQFLFTAPPGSRLAQEQRGAAVHRTTLMLAAFYGAPEVVTLLIQCGADPNLASPDDGFTALHCGCCSEAARAALAVAFLTQNGAREDVRSHDGLKPNDLLPATVRGAVPDPLRPDVRAALRLAKPGADATPRVAPAGDETAPNDPIPLGTGGSQSPAPAANASDDADPNEVASLSDPQFQTDDFRIYRFKVEMCPYTKVHDWTKCPFTHPGEKARRRDPRAVPYNGVACPDFRKGLCKRGDACPYAHGVFECWLHPTRYRVQMCKDGPNCTRKVCFFAHSPEELRTPPETPPDATSLHASLLDAAGLGRLQQMSALDLLNSLGRRADDDALLLLANLHFRSQLGVGGVPHASLIEAALRQQATQRTLASLGLAHLLGGHLGRGRGGAVAGGPVAGRGGGRLGPGAASAAPTSVGHGVHPSLLGALGSQPLGIGSGPLSHAALLQLVNAASGGVGAGMGGPPGSRPPTSMAGNMGAPHGYIPHDPHGHGGQMWSDTSSAMGARGEGQAHAHGLYGSLGEALSQAGLTALTDGSVDEAHLASMMESLALYPGQGGAPKYG